MSLFDIFSTAGSALTAQTVRLNLTASNLANADSVSGQESQTYRARHPVFSAAMHDFAQEAHATGVRVVDVVESQAPLPRQYRPEHPMADAEGYVTLPNVNTIEEMTNMISAARAYQNNVELVNTSKDLLLRTLSLGQ